MDYVSGMWASVDSDLEQEILKASLSWRTEQRKYMETVQPSAHPLHTMRDGWQNGCRKDIYFSHI